jgi:Heat-labile enterotoxin alpha chain
LATLEHCPKSSTRGGITTTSLQQTPGQSLDLQAHAEGAPGSGYVATSRSLNATGAFGKGGPVYKVTAPGGVDVNVELGANSPYPHELEVAYPGGIPAQNIKGAWMPNGLWVPNPGYKGP